MEDHVPEKGELIVYTLRMDINKIKNKLSQIYMNGIQDSKTSYFESMLVKTEKKLKDQIELDRKEIIAKIDIPWTK